MRPVLRWLLTKTARRTPWYLAGGVNRLNCVFAYQFVGATSLAASYTNLANPGTYNAVEIAAPAWAQATGAQGNNSGCMRTGYALPTNGPATHTMIAAVYITNASSTGTIVGRLESAPVDYRIGVHYSDGGIRHVYPRSYYANAPAFGAIHVVATTGNACYFDGAKVADISPTAMSTALEMCVMAANTSALDKLQAGAFIRACATYNTALSAAQVAAISSAMLALSGSTPPF